MEKLFLSIKDRLPYSLSFISSCENIIYLKDENRREYHLFVLDKIQLKTYYEIIKSKCFLNSIFEFESNNLYYLLFESVINKSEQFSIKNIDILDKIFDDFKFLLKINKQHISKFNNLYKVLDNKFSYLELRIREIETKPIHDDNDWIILSRYYIILDSRIYLYDIQNDIFKMIDNNQEEYYGLIIKNLIDVNYKNGSIEPKFDLYYGLISALYSRIYLAYDHIDLSKEFRNKLDKMSSLNKKYFFFLTLYIYILNINLEIIINNSCLQSYINITNRIKKFINLFQAYVK